MPVDMTSDIRSRCTVRDGDGDSIAVFGADAVDISAIMAAAVTECTIIIGVDVKPNRLELARELGATHTINGAESEAVEEIGKHHRRRR